MPEEKQSAPVPPSSEASVVSAARRGKQRRELGKAQTEAQHDDARHHRDRAEEHRTEAAVAEERSRRAEAEAQLDEERAGRCESELQGR